jgi:hypothetical protein
MTIFDLALEKDQRLLDEALETFRDPSISRREKSIVFATLTAASTVTSTVALTAAIIDLVRLRPAAMSIYLFMLHNNMNTVLRAVRRPATPAVTLTGAEDVW